MFVAKIRIIGEERDGNSLAEMVLMSNHNIYFEREIGQNYLTYCQNVTLSGALHV